MKDETFEVECLLELLKEEKHRNRILEIRLKHFGKAIKEHNIVVDIGAIEQELAGEEK